MPENLKAIESSYCLSFEHQEILTIDNFFISNNIVNKVGKTNILGCLAKFEISGKDLKNNLNTAHGIIFDPGWSIPVNMNGVQKHEILVTIGRELYISFIDKTDFMLVRVYDNR